MLPYLQIVERSAIDALHHALQKYDIDLPQAFRQQALQLLLQTLMEIDVSHAIDASRYERNGARRAYRNGYRPSAWIIDGENIPLRIPKLRRGSYYPAFLDHPDIDSALHDLILTCYLNITTDAHLTAFLERLKISAHPSQIAHLHEQLYDFAASYHQNIIATANIQLDAIPIQQNGHRRYLALAFDDDVLLDHEITPQADQDFWRDFVRRLDGRVIHGVEYVVVSHVHTVVRHRHQQKPEMALAA